MLLRCTLFCLALGLLFGCRNPDASAPAADAGRSQSAVEVSAPLSTIDAGSLPAPREGVDADAQPSLAPLATSKVVAATLLGATSRAAAPKKKPSHSLAGIDMSEVVDLEPFAGWLAVATTGGLVFMKDGALVGRIGVDAGLPEPALRAIHVFDSRLWLAFEGAGCQVLSPGLLLESCPKGTQGHRITDFATHAGALYAVTWRGAVLEIGLERAQERLPEGTLAFARQAVSCAGGLWVGSRGSGIGVLGESGWKAVRGPQIVDAMDCVAGVVRVAGPEGLYEWDGKLWQGVDLGSKRTHVTALGAYGSGTAAALADGTLQLVGPTGTRPVALGGRAEVLQEVDGVLNVGGPGLFGRVVDEVFEPIALPGPGAVDVSAVATFGEGVALGFFREGVALTKRAAFLADEAQWTRLRVADGLPSDEINALTFAPDGTLWIATSRGLVRYADGKATRLLFDPQMQCLHVNTLFMGTRGLWLGTSCGVGLVDVGQGSLLGWFGMEQGLPHKIVYAITEWNGQVVAGTNDGLGVRDLADDAALWSVQRAGPEGIRDNWITALAVTGETLWVGTYNAGVYRGTGLSELTRVEGPGFVNLNAVQAVGDSVYIGGLSEGAFVVDAVEPVARARALGLGSCLPGSDVTGFAAVGEDVLVATRSGAWVLPPQCTTAARIP